MNIRTRFAPSPTGYMHVGGVRTALFAWLIAKQKGGSFILRLEDTDQKRKISGAEKHIEDSLKALGLFYDEGPDKPGDFGPYRQSERLDSYVKWAKFLIESGRAYADPYSADEVQAFRDQAQKAKQPFLYRNHRPAHPPTWKKGMPLRFLSEPKSYTHHDLVMGDLTTGPEMIDDIILIKSDGFPTYNFAHIIDDYEMQISHIIRGQEFLSSIPNYLNLYDALGFTPPKMATVPHIMAADGRKKLSKRDGAKDVLEYVNDGFLPEALVSFMATLGWNDGTEQEIFTRYELLEKFNLERVQRSGAKFDQQRLEWVNGHFIRQTPVNELYDLIDKGFWPAAASKASKEHKLKVTSLIQERLKYLGEVPELTSFFFSEPKIDLSLVDDNKQLKKFSRQELRELLVQACASLEKSDFSTTDLTKRLNRLLESTGQKPGVLFSIIRIASTWAPASPGLAETLAVLGKETTSKRLEAAIHTL